MADTLTKQQRSARMALIGGRNTGPEMVVRRLVHRLGYRYRLHGAGLPGRPDLVFRTRRRVIFVHGCFWHRHSASTCKLARLPKSGLDFWGPKLRRNAERDRENEARLHELGWRYLVLWECELRNTASISERLNAFLQDEIA